MTKILKLDPHTINSIAAGEVIDRPASVVKELVDNALDAGAESVKVEIRAGGVREIRVRDDGTGMAPDDARLAIESHTTSKLRQVSDLDQLVSMGFRGEALPSIAAVSRLSLATRQIGSETGYRIQVEGGAIQAEGPIGTPEGTVITVQDLFYNTPARYKFLKSDQAESMAVYERVSHLALTRPDVSIQLERDGKTILHTPGNNDLLSAIFAVFGQEIAENMSPVEHAENPVRVHGYMTKPTFTRGNRARQVFIVNGRVIRSRLLAAAVEEAGQTYFMKGKHPALVLHLTIPTPFVDVNVHPQKSEVRFWDDRKVFGAVYHAIRRMLLTDQDIAARYDAPVTVTETAPDVEPDALSTAAAKPVEPKQLEMPIAQARPRQAYEQTETPQAEPVQETPATYHAEPSETRRIDRLVDAKYLGQYLNTYLVMQRQTTLILLDQHAAHERILYERLLRQGLEALKTAQQPLLIPLEVTVSAEEALYVEQHLADFASLGFALESFGPASFLLRTVPHVSKHVDAKALFLAMVNTLNENEYRQDEAFHDAFALRACKAAIKANQSLTELEVRQLLDDLRACERPYHCPHGRPVFIEIEKSEIEKRFGRIV